MAIYHLSIKTHSRTARTRGGKRMTVSAAHSVAYAQRTALRDEYTQELKSYGNRGEDDLVSGSAKTFLSDGSEYKGDLQELWSKFDSAETRINSRVCRTMDIALPHELTDEQCIALSSAYAAWLAVEFKTVVSIGMHYPPITGDKRNRHLHAVMPTREYNVLKGTVGAKIRRLDLASKFNSTEGKNNADYHLIREKWADFANIRLKQVGAQPIDHRSYADQGIEKPAGVHLGPVATAMTRRKNKSGENFKSRREYYGENLARIYASAMEMDPHNTAIGDLKNHLTKLGNQQGAIEAELAEIAKYLADIEKREAKLDERVSIDEDDIRASIAFDKHTRPFGKYEKICDDIDVNDKTDAAIYGVGRALEANQRRLEALSKFRPPLTPDDLISRLRRKYVVKPVIEYIDAQIAANQRIAKLDPSKALQLRAECDILLAKRKIPSKTEWFKLLDANFVKELSKHKKVLSEVANTELPKWARYVETVNRRAETLPDKLAEMGGLPRYESARGRINDAIQAGKSATADLLKTAPRTPGRLLAAAKVKLSVKTLRECGKTEEEIQYLLAMQRLAEELHRQAELNRADAVKHAVETIAAIFGRKAASRYVEQTERTEVINGYRKHKHTARDDKLYAKTLGSETGHRLRELSERHVVPTTTRKYRI